MEVATKHCASERLPRRVLRAGDSCQPFLPSGGGDVKISAWLIFLGDKPRDVLEDQHMLRHRQAEWIQKRAIVQLLRSADYFSCEVLYSCEVWLEVGST